MYLRIWRIFEKLPLARKFNFELSPKCTLSLSQSGWERNRPLKIFLLTVSFILPVVAFALRAALIILVNAQDCCAVKIIKTNASKLTQNNFSWVFQIWLQKCISLKYTGLSIVFLISFVSLLLKILLRSEKWNDFIFFNI